MKAIESSLSSMISGAHLGLQGAMLFTIAVKYVAMVLVLVYTHKWIYGSLNGVTWDKGQQFNYHPLFTIIGLAVLGGQGKGGFGWQRVLRLMD